jgi:prepilin-type N-terminal cleavage/methylation domain-containing protein
MRGFTLVELCIVLVIVGLLTGGVMMGGHLIRAAEVRSVVTETQQFIAANNTFRLKYNALPGDMHNATAMWGIAGGDGQNNACYTTISKGPETCNGDGNGQISGNVPEFNERYRYWQHLANSGIIPGAFIGTNAAHAGYSYPYVRGINAPGTRLASDALWYAAWVTAMPGNAVYFAAPPGNTLRITFGALTPEENRNIDSKIDDGLPGKGKVMVFKGSNIVGVDNCSTAGGIPPPGDATAQYNFAETAKVCNPWVYF